MFRRCEERRKRRGEDGKVKKHVFSFGLLVFRVLNAISLRKCIFFGLILFSFRLPNVAKGSAMVNPAELGAAARPTALLRCG